jgi:hypothetical protein
MNVLGIKQRVQGQSGVFEVMRVLPLNGWNIWNINIYKKNIYIKQIDKQHSPITPDRNRLDHTGTSFRSLFCKCSTNGICRSTSPALVNQGLQRTFRKSRSAMFRLAVPSTYRPESPVNRGLAAFNF